MLGKAQQFIFLDFLLLVQHNSWTTGKERMEIMKQSKIQEGVPYTDGKSVRIIVDREPECYGPYWLVWYRTTKDRFKKVHECSLGAFAKWAVRQHEELSDQILLAIRPNNGADVLPDNLEIRVEEILKREVQRIEEKLVPVSTTIQDLTFL